MNSLNQQFCKFHETYEITLASLSHKHTEVYRVGQIKRLP